MTITHSDAGAPAQPSNVLLALLAEVADADTGVSLKLTAAVAYQARCDFCEPDDPPAVVIATIALIDNTDRLIRRTTCAGCLHAAVLWSTYRGRNVTIRAAVGDGTTCPTS